ncbi:hypothetical protein [Endozoicomonas sp. SCSIO W0465]|uniref:hypothetical protein n=1 Tax=Endozoicomonas sp. SCSIO W0465 TaxID=2918516 RepID=UPI002075C04F|nr:hypothetical protein [Endozoicomonas sp. SCSIO W0465]USE35129.1 hypothetical protein MJO57_23940 [Endozoicomonas sp. SCSIO W0465]
MVAGADQTFAQFLQQLQAENPDADFSPEPVRQLVYRYWQSLDKDDKGRTATLVEGPAGWGKDFILDRTIRRWQSSNSGNISPSHRSSTSMPTRTSGLPWWTASTRP